VSCLIGSSSLLLYNRQKIVPILRYRKPNCLLLGLPREPSVNRKLESIMNLLNKVSIFVIQVHLDLSLCTFTSKLPISDISHLMACVFFCDNMNVYKFLKIHTILEYKR